MLPASLHMTAHQSVPEDLLACTGGTVTCDQVSRKLSLMAWVQDIYVDVCLPRPHADEIAQLARVSGGGVLGAANRLGQQSKAGRPCRVTPAASARSLWAIVLAGCVWVHEVATQGCVPVAQLFRQHARASRHAGRAELGCMCWTWQHSPGQLNMSLL